MRIAIFSTKVIPTNAIGTCYLQLLTGLSQEHEFTVFAVEFENPCPERIRFVRVPVPTRPLALLFVAYHLTAPVIYWFYRLRSGMRFDLIQMVESKLSFGTVSYAHSCHRAYLRYHWKQVQAKGLRGWLRYLNHWLHALVEPWVFRRVKHIVVPSQGLKRELEETYPFTREKITMISNPIDLDRMAMPKDFDREGFRKERGASTEDIVFVFVALGHFEHKGLGLVLEALRLLANPQTKLWVVGGMPDLVTSWQKRVHAMGLAKQVTFFGMQRDVRPFLWGADAFLFPSVYEVFPLVSLEAAAAGLPLIVTPLYGVEEFMRDGETGFIVERSVEGVAQGLRRLLELTPTQRRELGQRARKSVMKFEKSNFVKSWQEFLSEDRWKLPFIQ